MKTISINNDYTHHIHSFGILIEPVDESVDRTDLLDALNEFGQKKINLSKRKLFCSLIFATTMFAIIIYLSKL